jgi:prolipoprotein diacylglyceryl transferase
LQVFRIWEAGLASHGAGIAIILAIWMFSSSVKKIDPKLSAIRLLDFICVPAAFAGACIRIGNFINQEILGISTNLPWAIVFGSPADGSLPVPRHPVQLYESAFYLMIFFYLWKLVFKPFSTGRLIGLFLVLVFSFRFIIEFIKLEQSALLLGPYFFTMGQWLSIPLIALGFIWIRMGYKKQEHISQAPYR